MWRPGNSRCDASTPGEDRGSGRSIWPYSAVFVRRHADTMLRFRSARDGGRFGGLETAAISRAWGRAPGIARRGTGGMTGGVGKRLSVPDNGSFVAQGPNPTQRPSAPPATVPRRRRQGPTSPMWYPAWRCARDGATFDGRAAGDPPLLFASRSGASAATGQIAIALINADALRVDPVRPRGAAVWPGAGLYDDRPQSARASRPAFTALAADQVAQAASPTTPFSRASSCIRAWSFSNARTSIWRIRSRLTL